MAGYKHHYTSLMITYWPVEISDVQDHSDSVISDHTFTKGLTNIRNNISKQFFTFRATVKNTATK